MGASASASRVPFATACWKKCAGPRRTTGCGTGTPVRRPSMRSRAPHDRTPEYHGGHRPARGSPRGAADCSEVAGDQQQQGNPEEVFCSDGVLCQHDRPSCQPRPPQRTGCRSAVTSTRPHRRSRSVPRRPAADAARGRTARQSRYASSGRTIAAVTAGPGAQAAQRVPRRCPGLRSSQTAPNSAKPSAVINGSSSLMKNCRRDEELHQDGPGTDRLRARARPQLPQDPGSRNCATMFGCPLACDTMPGRTRTGWRRGTPASRPAGSAG